MSGNRDVRALRTRHRLVTAYRELVADGSGGISVSSVVKRAGVTRSSFYAHFSDASDLAVAALAELFDVVGSVDSASRRRGDESLHDVSEHSLAEVIGFIDARRDEYRELLSRTDRFAQAVEDAFMARSLATLTAAGSTTADPVVTARFIAAGVMGVVAWWLREEPGGTVEELARHLARVIPADFTSNASPSADKSSTGRS
jgi:AcrR family transcriptional regulator